MNNFTAHVPSPSTTVTNDQAPWGFLLLSAQSGENVPRQDIPTLTGVLRTVGLPEITYDLKYFTMDAVASALALEYVDTATVLELVYFGVAVDNVFMIGLDIAIQPVDGDRGILAMLVTQHLVALAQRVDYGA